MYIIVYKFGHHSDNFRSILVENYYYVFDHIILLSMIIYLTYKNGLVSCEMNSNDLILAS